MAKKSPMKHPERLTEPAGDEWPAFGVTTLPGARVTAISEDPDPKGRPVKAKRIDFPPHLAPTPSKRKS